ncbi:GntR family transcriptional regulator [Pseudonocardia alni]|jgi:DNA-binding GntR family transcriptional regulator|uniref:DNA-binding GntR family transcriptional regulator n=1 Tax=Pseudonocardia alni TaxID=33907 RepID=A0A852W1C7_PSEA5|nr:MULTISPECIES: GntR family transcriptional regulator [Pseudonocardia]OJG08340.1 HTH-type transcriptional regulator McbR [Pseudonocardia autotrophica]MCO7195369.1 GntR family transcriptional regulator [Pseudonocardia sp. McavD-2-B]MYW70651.1 FCD domain-containing protein [Pseudonocardia sp. SID8383]NYG00644.1 DNA-binding GntR family transcriptional regulator [Pseudonocardia antarctica]PKB33584.1 DNA-binding GntR family transcriptional regulator [Pseudonocardia alni]
MTANHGAPAVDRVHTALRAEILDGVRPAGSRLREEEIAEAHGTSRTPTREAIRRLAADGLAELTPRRGAVVLAWDDDDLDELFDLRVLLEGHAAARAAVSGRADLARMRDLCAAMEAVEDPPDHAEITRLNLALHHEIHRAGGRRALRELVGRVVEAPLVRTTFRRYTAERLARSFAQHRELVAALAARDPEWARAVMTAHLRAAREVVRDRAGPPDRTAAADRRP